MKILVTGTHGTVGQAVLARAHPAGISISPWNRQVAPPDDPAAGESMINQTRPDAIMHLAMPAMGSNHPDEGRIANIEWSEFLAAACHDRHIPFLFASTAMVFTNAAKGPFYPDTPPDATEGYGGEKRRGEERVMAVNPHAIIARLGWQIGQGPGGNNMIDYFVSKMRDDGVIQASRKNLPATSFVEDTADVLLHLIKEKSPGIHHVSSNDRWSFYQIACALNIRHGNQWKIMPTDDVVYDQRLLDDRIKIPLLGDRLPELMDLVDESL